MAPTYSGIDIGNSNLKIAAVRKEGSRYIVETLQSEKLGNLAVRRGNEFNTSGIAAITKRIYETSRISTRKVTLGLGGKDSMFRFIEVPPVSDDQIRKLLEYEQGEATKTIADKTCTDYQMLALSRQGVPTGAAIVATAREADIAEDTRLLTGANLQLQGVVPKSLALHRLLADSAIIHESETAMLIDIGSDQSEIVIMQGPHLVMARSAAIGGRVFTESVARAFNIIPEVAEEIKLAEGAIIVDGKRPSRMSEYRDGFDELIASEGIKFRNDPHYASNLSRALASGAEQLRLACDSAIRYAMVQTKIKNIQIDRILLSGAGAKLPGILEYLAGAFRIPVQYWDAIGFFDASAVPLDKRDCPTEFSVALALAYVASLPAGTTISLVPESTRERARFLERDLFAIAGAFLLVFGLGLWALSANTESGRMREASDAIGATLKRARADEKELAGRMDRIKLNSDRSEWFSKETYYNPLVVKFITTLQSVVPESIYISEIRFAADIELSSATSTKTITSWRFTVRGFVSKDVSELQQAGQVGVLVSKIEKLPYVIKCVPDNNEQGIVTKKAKTKLSPDVGSYKFALYFYVSENGELRQNEIAKP